MARSPNHPLQRTVLRAVAELSRSAGRMVKESLIYTRWTAHPTYDNITCP